MHVPDQFLSFEFCNETRMEATIDIEFLLGIGPESIFKELALVSDGVVKTFLLKPPYAMHAHGSEENGLIGTMVISPTTN